MSRYDRFKQILDEAAAGSTADYGGIGPFWHLELPRLLDTSLSGIRLIAPEKESAHSCCGCAPAPAAQTRSERSGLIAGLQGEYPFDGQQYPRLPWGGNAVSADNIAFIARWIDDGCPAGGDGAEIGAFELADQPVVVEREGYSLYEGIPNEYKYKHGELRQRMNLDCMTPGQLENLREAFRELYDLNKWPLDARNYNNLALIHQNHCQHGWERFLPWHRVYMYEFEKALQDVCPSVTMPYWDWTLPQYPKNPIPDAFQAFLTEESLEFLKTHEPTIPGDEIEKLKPLLGNLYPTQSGFFSAISDAIGAAYTRGHHRERFIDALLAANPLWYPLRYPGQFGGSTINAVIHYHYPSPDDIQEIMSLRTFRDFGGGSLYNDSFGFLDQNPHNTMHIWTGGMKPAPPTAPGLTQLAVVNRNKTVKVANRQFHTKDDMYSEPDYGDMFSNLTASYDPIFWPVHSNVNRLWSEWQQAHPDSPPADLDSVLTPWSYTIRETLDIHRFGYEYVKSSYVIPVGAQAPVGRFVSKPIDLSDIRARFLSSGRSPAAPRAPARALLLRTRLPESARR